MSINNTVLDLNESVENLDYTLVHYFGIVTIPNYSNITVTNAKISGAYNFSTINLNYFSVLVAKGRNTSL